MIDGIMKVAIAVWRDIVMVVTIVTDVIVCCLLAMLSSLMRLVGTTGRGCYIDGLV